MSNIITPGAHILFMKVGTHAKESLSDIIARKLQEIADEGFAMWGYGGNTCHPATMVQPFANSGETLNAPIYLCMQKVNSRHFAEPLRANQFSENGTIWQDIPKGINVRGSRFALCLEDLREDELILPLSKAQVAIGLSKGRPASRYIQGHVDKACLEVMENNLPNLTPEDHKEVRIDLVAKLKSPYAVFLRDHR